MNFLPFFFSLVLSLAFTPAVRWMSIRLGRIKQPRQDRWHRKPIPTLGGVGIFMAASITLIGFSFFKGWQTNIAIFSLFLGPAIAFFFGLFDDFRPLSPPVKLIGQLVAATIVIFYGDFAIRFFPWPAANILLTYFWLIGITNAINLLDNMDGLAGGVALIAAGFLGYFFWQVRDNLLWSMALAMAGSILGFLVFNYPPARLFMGDAGSQFLGFTLASLAIARKAQASNVFAVMGVPTLLFLLPILDTALVTITRILRGQSPGQGGTDHASHRLVSFGLSERQVLAVLYSVAIVCGLSAAALESLDYDASLVLIPIVLIILFLLTAYLARFQVISPPTSPPLVQVQGMIRWFADLTYRRRLFEIMLDLLIIVVAYYLAYWTSYGLDMTTVSMTLFLNSWPIAVGTAYLAFFLAGVYRGVWKYIGSLDLVRYALAVVGSVLATGSILWLLPDINGYPLDVFFLYGIFLLLGLAGSRLSFVLLDRIYQRQLRSSHSFRILLVGADDAGELVLRWITQHPELGYRPVGFIDEESKMWGRSIHGVDVLGGKNRLKMMLESGEVDGVILVSQATNEEINRKEILRECRAHNIWVRVLRIDFTEIT